MSASITSIGLRDAARFFEALPDIAEQAAVLAINQVAERDGLAFFKREMRSQINFPSGYLEQDGRLAVSRRANRTSLEAVIRGRDRATSLARFARPGQTPRNTRGRGVRVQVKAKGGADTLEKAFLVNLRNGNVGLAIRLPAGQRPESTQRAVRLGLNLWLLYGPSVDQVFSSVAEEEGATVANMLSNQFLRQFARLSTRG